MDVGWNLLAVTSKYLHTLFPSFFPSPRFIFFARFVCCEHLISLCSFMKHSEEVKTNLLPCCIRTHSCRTPGDIRTDNMWEYKMDSVALTSHSGRSERQKLLWWSEDEEETPERRREEKISQISYRQSVNNFTHLQQSLHFYTFLCFNDSNKN